MVGTRALALYMVSILSDKHVAAWDNTKLATNDPKLEQGYVTFNGRLNESSPKRSLKTKIKINRIS